jgi:hypothetical protein
MDHLHFPAIIYAFIYEIIEGVSFFHVISHQQIGPLQTIKAKRAEGDQLGLSLFLDADEVADGGYPMDQIVLSQRIDRSAAVPSRDLIQLKSQSFHGGHGGHLQVPGPGFQSAAGIVSQAHFLYL